jgi:hypothetical protein
MLDQTKQAEAPCKTAATRSLTAVDTEAHRSKLSKFLNSTWLIRASRRSVKDERFEQNFQKPMA